MRYNSLFKTFLFLYHCLFLNQAFTKNISSGTLSLDDIAGKDYFTDFFQSTQLIGKDIIDLMYDNQGNIWTATTVSLMRYDGYEWFVYDTSSGLPQARINCIIYTNQFGLLLGTEKGVFQLKSNKWESALFSDKLSGTNCSKIIKVNNNEIIFCFTSSADKTKPGGVTICNQGKWEKLTKSNGLPTNQVYYFHRAKNGELYLAGEKNVFKKESLNWKPIPQMKGHYIRDILNHPTMGLFFSSFSHYKMKSHLFNKKGDKYIYLESFTNKIKQFMPLSIHPDGELITTARTSYGQRLFKVVTHDNAIQMIPISTTIPSTGGEIKSIMSTNDGAIWIAGDELLARWKRDLPQFTRFESVTGSPILVSENKVWIQDKERTFYYNFSRHCLKETQNQKIIGKISSKEVWLKDKKNLFTLNKPKVSIPLKNIPITNLNKIHGSEGNFTRWGIGMSKEQEVHIVKFFAFPDIRDFKKVFSLQTSLLSQVCDHSNQLWILHKNKTTKNLSIHRFFPDLRTSFEYKIKGNQGTLTLDSRNHLWLFSENQIKIFDRESNQFKDIPEIPKTPFCKIIDYPPSGTLFSFRKNQVWNIAYFTDNKWTFLSDPIIKGEILSILEDKKIILSLPGQRQLGILRGFPDNKEPLGMAILPISKDLSLRYNKRKILSYKDSLWFSVQGDGLHKPYIMAWNPRKKSPKTIIENNTPTSRIDQKFSLFLRALVTNQKQNNSQTFWFSWKIQNKEWTPFKILENNFLILPKLEHGSYELKVKSMDMSGNIEQNPANISFKINPIPLQEKNWFPYVISGIIFLMGFLLINSIRKAFQLRRINQTLKHEISQRKQAQGAVETARKLLEIKVLERTKALEKSNQKLNQTHNALMDASRKAGMTEVATGIIHNVGNVLNSLNIAIIYLQKNLQTSKISGLHKLSEMIIKHKFQSDFLIHDEKGKYVPEYLEKLSQNAKLEKSENLHLLGDAKQHINHIREIVQTQQTFAKITSVPEPIDVNQTLRDAAKMNLDQFSKHQIDYQEDFTPLPTLQCDRSKIMQIIINLLQNATDACAKATPENKKIVLRTTIENPAELHISVQDFGIGIPSKNLDRIFNHGFTSKNNGHGFGLHNAANSAKQMDGRLEAFSQGYGTGSTFTIILPIKTVETPLEEISSSKIKKSQKNIPLKIKRTHLPKIPLKPQ